MEESGRRILDCDDCGGGDVGRELLALLAISDDDCEDGEVPIREEMVEEVMRELWKEISHSYGESKPPSEPAGFQACSSSFRVAGGHKESCGASFSDSSSTVMAGIEVGGVRRCANSCFEGMGQAGEFAGGRPGSPEVNGSGLVGEGGCRNAGAGHVKMEGCDCGELDDEWLTRLLMGWGPQQFDEWM